MKNLKTFAAFLLAGQLGALSTNPDLFRDLFRRPDSAQLGNGWEQSGFLGFVDLRNQEARFGFLPYSGFFSAEHKLPPASDRGDWASSVDFRVGGAPLAYDERAITVVFPQQAGSSSSGAIATVNQGFFQWTVYANGIPIATDHAPAPDLFDDSPFRIRLSRSGSTFSAALIPLENPSQAVSLSVDSSIDLCPTTIRIRGANHDGDPTDGNHLTEGAFDRVFFGWN